MKQTIRLTESDMVRLIQRVVREDKGEEIFGKSDFMTKYLDSMDRDVNDDIEFSEKREFGPEDYDSFMEYINNCNTKWCITTKMSYDYYLKKGNITVGKGRRK